MPQSRKSQVNLMATPYYHCISRCVRRAFLCGEDEVTGKSYEHRREWVETKLLFLSTVFAIDICAYAVMSNHTHIVLHVDKMKAEQWDTKEVITRWHQLFKGTLLTQAFLQEKELAVYEQVSVEETASVYRERLMSISWFMRVLNEGIARKANQEDHCTGRFWEGRFKTQALLDEKAVVACMAYVDLNPIRAGIAITPQTSDYTSIKRRVHQALAHEQPKELMPLSNLELQGKCQQIPFDLMDYIKLVGLSAQSITEGRLDFMDSQFPNILSQLGVSEKNWFIMMTRFTKEFRGAVGTVGSLTEFAIQQDKRRRSNFNSSLKLLA